VVEGQEGVEEVGLAEVGGQGWEEEVGLAEVEVWG
jgi:hypothetical protein